MKKLVSAAVLACALVVGAGVPAHAAPAKMSDDEMFLLLLDMSDYYYGSSASGAISLAQDVCKRMKAASSPAAKKRTMKTIGKALDLSGWPAGKQGYFLSVSMQTYCPSQEKYLF